MHIYYFLSSWTIHSIGKFYIVNEFRGVLEINLKKKKFW